MKELNKFKINENVDYIFENVKKDLKIINTINNELYFELTKEEIVNCLNKVYDRLTSWKKYLLEENIDKISKEYKDVEGIISELELCLIDYDNLLNIEAISYTFYQLGNELIGLLDKKEMDSDKNV